MENGCQASRTELLLNRIRVSCVLHLVSSFTNAAAHDMIPFLLKALGNAGKASQTEICNKLLLGQGARQIMNCRRPCGLGTVLAGKA